MKIKITVSIEEVHNQVEHYFKSHYQQWVDYACYHRSNAKVQIDIVDLLTNIEVKVQCLKQEQTLSLMYSKHGDHTQLDFFVMSLIKNSIHKQTRSKQSKNYHHATD